MKRYSRLFLSLAGSLPVSSAVRTKMSQMQPAPPVEYVCSCFFKKQIFVKKYSLHVAYENDHQFQNDYRQKLRFKGCSTERQYESVISEVKAEIERRESYHSTFLDNYKRNQENYRYIHPEVKNLQRNFVDPRFLNIVQDENLANVDAIQQTIMSNRGQIYDTRVYSFPIFTEEFCKLLVEEMINFRQSLTERSLPNTMNFEGVSLDEMGLSNTLVTSLITEYLQPITKVLFPDWGGGSIDSFKSFTVTYDHDKHPSLSRHFDNAEVSMSICLSPDFEGGDLELGQVVGEEEDTSQEPVVIEQKIGQCILHRSRQLHSAKPVTSGQRTNMIVWMRSSPVRNQICPMCSQPPDIQEVPIAGDGFTLGDRSASNSSCSCS